MLICSNCKAQSHSCHECYYCGSKKLYQEVKCESADEPSKRDTIEIKSEIGKFVVKEGLVTVESEQDGIMITWNGSPRDASIKSKNQYGEWNKVKGVSRLVITLDVEESLPKIEIHRFITPTRSTGADPED